MTPTTTKSGTRQGAALLTTGPGKAQQQPQPFPKNQNGSTMAHRFTEGQKARYVRQIVGGDDVDIRIGQHFTVDMIRDNTEAGDAFGPVMIHAHRDGDGKPFVFHQDELEPLRSDDTVPATDAEVVTFVTGVLPPVSAVDSWTCPECGWETHAAGPVDVDEPDPWQDGVDEHRRAHDLDAVRGTVGEVSAVPLWEALREVGSVYEALVGLRDLPAADVARALRAVADVLDGGAR